MGQKRINELDARSSFDTTCIFPVDDPTQTWKVTGAQILDAIALLSLKVGRAQNLGLAAATTTNAADSIKIKGAAAALSSTNPMYLVLPNSTTPGLLTAFKVEADVTIKIQGAHWGLGTLGDFSNIELRVYAINDNGTLKWGVSNQGGLRTITDTNTHTTATSVTTQPKMLVNSALTAGTWPCAQVGWFLANFDDTGGAAEDLWAVQTSVGSLNVGIDVPADSDWISCTVTSTWVAGATHTAKKKRVGGDTWIYNIHLAMTGAVTAATLVFTLDTGFVIDTSKLASGTALVALPGSASSTLDSGTRQFEATTTFVSSTTVAPQTLSDAATASTNNISSTQPFTYAINDNLICNFAVPMRGYSCK